MIVNRFHKVGDIMDFDAIAANVSLGGLTNRTSIRILLCCLIADAKQPVPVKPLQENLHFEGIANYFEVTYALDDLIKNGNIRPSDEDPDAYTATDGGKMIADNLRGDLPVTVLEKSTEIVNRILARARHEKENEVTFDTVGNGCMVNCNILEGDKAIMKLSLLMPDRISANRVRDKFLDDPESLYIDILERLTDAKLRDGDKK